MVFWEGVGVVCSLVGLVRGGQLLISWCMVCIYVYRVVIEMNTMILWLARIACLL